MRYCLCAYVKGAWLGACASMGMGRSEGFSVDLPLLPAFYGFQGLEPGSQEDAASQCEPGKVREHLCRVASPSSFLWAPGVRARRPEGCSITVRATSRRPLTILHWDAGVELGSQACTVRGFCPWSPVFCILKTVWTY